MKNTYNTNYYKILGINYPSSQEEIKNAYRSLAKKFHPDNGGSAEKMVELNIAYSILGDPVEKLAYDKWLLDMIEQDITFQTGTYTCKSDQNTNENTNNTEKHEYVNYVPKVIIYILTITGNIRTSYESSDKFTFDYRKYLYDGDELYFYEAKKGNSILTFITYKDIWDQMVASIHKTEQPRKKKHNLRICSILGVTGFALLFIIFLIYNNPNTSHSNTSLNKIPTTDTPRPSALPLPKNGQIFKTPMSECVAPFSIKTQGTEHYYIYLKAEIGKNNDISLFVKGGTSVEIDVPLGSYKLFYCSGSDWFGKQDKFGKDTAYYTSDNTLKFYQDGQYAYGNTITLYPVYNGNLNTKNINASEFPE